MTLALSLLFDPFCLRERSCCARLSFFSALRRNLGAAILVPSDRTAKCPSPRSIPISGASPVMGSGLVSITKYAKYRPAESLITVTLDGVEGSWRDQHTGTSPIFGKRSFPPSVIDQRALAVNRIDCRRSRRVLNLGAPILRPLRLPLIESKKFLKARSASRNDCCSTTADTSPSQDRPGVFFAAVISVLDSSADFGAGSPSMSASRRAAMASLNTTRAHPNAFASAVC
ncbi:hypothetical protein N599_31135 [Saccharopolyspora erythraea D]|nr:hypothetical protein N599_31135 [Saccharopolyspora erythraea D]